MARTSKEAIIINKPLDEKVFKKYYGRRTLKTRIKYVMEFRTEPIVLGITSLPVGAKLVVAYQKALKHKIKKVGDQSTVSDSTLQRRQKQGRKVETPREVFRYRSPKFSRDPDPNATGWLNHSGMLREGIKVGKPRFSKSKQHGVWTINVTRNRLHEESFGEGFQLFLMWFAALVEPEKIKNEKVFKNAMKKTLPDLTEKYRDKMKQKGWRKKLQTFRLAHGLARSIVTFG